MTRARMTLLVTLTCSLSSPDALSAQRRGGPQAEQESLPAHVRAACADVATLLEQLPGLAVVTADTGVVDPVTREESWGCTLSVTGVMSAFDETGTPDQRVRESLPALGWDEDWAYGADGPDGTAYAFRSGSVICYFTGSWDGGDITDPTYVSQDWYRMSAGCTEVAREHSRNRCTATRSPQAFFTIYSPDYPTRSRQHSTIGVIH